MNNSEICRFSNTLVGQNKQADCCYESRQRMPTSNYELVRYAAYFITFVGQNKQVDCCYESRQHISLCRVMNNSEIRRFPNAFVGQNKQADCCYESRRRISICRVMNNSEMRRLFCSTGAYILHYCVYLEFAV